MVEFKAQQERIEDIFSEVNNMKNIIDQRFRLQDTKFDQLSTAIASLTTAIQGLNNKPPASPITPTIAVP